MNPAQLLAHFDRISDAPDAVPRLRRFILDLAVRGKLVEQDLRDEPASELLRWIHAERVRLANEGKIRGQELTRQVEIEEQLFELPANWEWARFGEIADFSAGRTPSRHDFSFWNTGDHSWVSIADMKDGGVVLTTKETVSEKAKNEVFGSEPAPVGTMIMSFKLTIGKISRLGVPAFHNEAIISIHPHLPTMEIYLFKVLPQFSRQGDTKDAIKGATLNRDSITNILLPLPPLAEQHRIVAKVDELMALCDRLEAAHAEREGRRDRLAAASLHRLNRPAAPGAPQAFREHASFHLKHLPRLTTRPEHIKQLRQTILNLAVRGQLVPQDPTDGSAQSWLEGLASPSSMGRTIHSRAQADVIANVAEPFSIPRNWVWLKVADVFEVVGGIQKTPNRTPRDNAFPYLGVGNVYRGRLDLSNVKEFELEEGEIERWRLETGDLLIIEGNGSLNEIGRCARWNGEIRNCVHQNHVIRCRPVDMQIAPFVLLYLNSDAGIGIMQRLAITSSGLYSLSVGKIRQILLPLPPLAEQHRIVAKVDELMVLCDQLEAQLTTAQSESRRLLESVLHQTLDGGSEAA